MFKIFNLNSWSKLEKTIEHKSAIFLTQFSIIAVTGAAISMIHDFFFESWQTVLSDLLIVVIFLFCVLINERGRHLAAKLLFTVAGPATIFFYATLIPKSNGIYFYYFPIITITFLLFDKNEDRFKFGAIAYTLVLFLILEYFDYQPFGPPIYGDIASSTSYQLNLSVSLFVTIMSLVSFDKLNKIIEKKRAEALKLVNLKNKELKEINEELDQFVYSASHDLKAPLLSVLGLVNVAKYEVTDPTSLDYFGKIEQRIDKLNNFIKEVIEISRNARTEVQLEVINLKNLIELTFENNNYLQDHMAMQIECHVADDLTFYSDRNRLEIIFNNLISNAIKYRKLDGSAHTIHIEASKAGKTLSVIIKDNGVGIAAEHQEKVFDMFYRGNITSEGSGLGLYIVKSTLEKIGGEIFIHSTLGEGTTIRLNLPIIENKIDV